MVIWVITYQAYGTAWLVYPANSLLNVYPQANPVKQDHQDVQGLLQNGQPRVHEQAVLGLEKGG